MSQPSLYLCVASYPQEQSEELFLHARFGQMGPAEDGLLFYPNPFPNLTAMVMASNIHSAYSTSVFSPPVDLGFQVLIPTQVLNNSFRKCDPKPKLPECCSLELQPELPPTRSSV